MLSASAGWRVSLRRARADWPIVLAALLTMLLSTTLLATGPIYSSGVAVAGLRQLLADASIEAGNVRVSAGVHVDRIDATDEAVTAELKRVAGTIPAELALFGSADSFALPDQVETVRNLAVFSFAEGVERHATLLDGAWPAPEQLTPAPAPVPVAISDAVADQLGLSVGNEMEVTNRLDASLVMPISVAGVFRIDEPADPYWWSDTRALDGLTVSDQYDTYGPFLMSRGDLLTRAALRNISMSWRLIPDYAGITIDEADGLKARVDALPARLDRAAPADSMTVVTDLPATLAAAQRALLVSRTGMLLVMAQLALLGGYAILLTAGLLIDHRRVETALLRSRGAGPGHIAGLAAVEGVLLAVPAVILGPWLALLTLEVFGRIGPLGEAGLAVPLQVTADAYVVAALAGGACVLLLALPALFAARPGGEGQRGVAREETRPLAQRLGIDIALLAVAAVALWQLSLYGTPLTRNLQGALGPDPLLVAAPALGLVLGAIIATRLLPRLAEAAQQVLTRGRGLVGALGSSQLARRPLRYTRSALMLMLAMSIAVFAVSYATTWADSQRSQADQQVGVDVRVVPSRSPRAVPVSALGAAYAALPGVTGAVPVERSQFRVGRTAYATLLAFDTDTAAPMLRFRADQASAPLADLLAPLAEARPSLYLPTIPAGADNLPLTVTSKSPGDATDFDARTMTTASVAVRDELGLIHRRAAPPASLVEARSGIVIPLADLAGRLEVVSLDLLVEVPSDPSLDLPTAWSLAVSDVGVSGDRSWATGTQELTADAFGRMAVSMQPPAMANLAMAEIPVLVSRPLLAETALNVDDTMNIDLAGIDRRVRIVSVVDSFPTTDGVSPVVVADLPTLALLRIASALSGTPDTATVSETRLPDEWWLDTNGAAAATADEIRDSLVLPPFVSNDVETAAGRLRSLISDPVAIAIIGALGLGALAAGLFALIGLAVAAAVSTRQRQSEFALVRALGMSRRQLTGWLWLENGSLAVVSVFFGALIGALISWIVLPSVAVTGDGLPPTPPVIVTLPYGAIVVLALVAALVVAAVVAIMASALRRIGIGNILRMSED